MNGRSLGSRSRPLILTLSILQVTVLVQDLADGIAVIAFIRFSRTCLKGHMSR